MRPTRNQFTAKGTRQSTSPMQNLWGVGLETTNQHSTHTHAYTQNGRKRGGKTPTKKTRSQSQHTVKPKTQHIQPAEPLTNKERTHSRRNVQQNIKTLTQHTSERNTYIKHCWQDIRQLKTRQHLHRVSSDFPPFQHDCTSPITTKNTEEKRR